MCIRNVTQPRQIMENIKFNQRTEMALLAEASDHSLLVVARSEG